MNCREAQDQIFAERDGALASHQGAALAGHIAGCAHCRGVRDNLASALTRWRNDVARVTVPDAEREWHAVRRRIRGGAEAGTTTTLRPRRNFIPWLAIPVGAAAAVALALFVGSPTNTPHAGTTTQTARAYSADAPGDASTMAFVDEKSGWLIVWANDAVPKSG
jgi:hypothetical protein